MKLIFSAQADIDRSLMVFVNFRHVQGALCLTIQLAVKTLLCGELVGSKSH